MYAEYPELLAYEGIEESVAELYRAFIDTQLAVLAGNPASYWNEVKKFRFEQFGLERESSSQEPTEMDQDVVSIDSEDSELEHRYAYLYWFDIRADFWIRTDSERELLLGLISLESLDWIYEQARAAQARLDRAKKVEIQLEGMRKSSQTTAFGTRRVGAAAASSRADAESRSRDKRYQRAADLLGLIKSGTPAVGHRPKK
ncbi:MAG TPA: hypothetical protein VJV78_43100 [Polyangiales bacterium]|nr:hypothetical protein [Polyangiales bacterium]